MSWPSPSRLLRLVALAACLAGLGACARFEAKPLVAAQTGEAFADRNLDDPGLLAFLAEQGAGAAIGGWTPDRLALAAAYFHPDVALARAELEEASAAITTARQRPNPVFTFAPQFASQRVSYVPWFFAPSLTIPIETAGKREHRSLQAEAMAEAARCRLTVRAWAARSRVRAAMLECHGARENIRLLEREQTLHDDAIKKLTAQMEAGDVSPFELTQARLALNRTRLALQDAQRISVTAEAKLAAAIGVPLAALRAVRLDFSPFTRLPQAAPETTQRLALTQRADLLALLAEYAAAEAALHLEIAKQYPDVRLSPGFDYNQGQNRWQLGMSADLPLNGNRGPIAQAEAKRKTTEARFLAQQRAIQGELDIALAAYRASRAKAEVAADLAKEAVASADTTRRMVEAGDVSPLELTRRQIETSAADLALMAARIEAQTAAGVLEDAMQVPLP